MICIRKSYNEYGNRRNLLYKCKLKNREDMNGAFWSSSHTVSVEAVIQVVSDTKHTLSNL